MVRHYHLQNSKVIHLCSVTSGSAFTSARLISVAGREGYLPALFGRHHKTLKTPLNAMCLQAGITTLFIVIGGGFRSLINFAVVASWAFYFLTVRGGPLWLKNLLTVASIGLRPDYFTCERADVGEVRDFISD